MFDFIEVVSVITSLTTSSGIATFKNKLNITNVDIFNLEIRQLLVLVNVVLNRPSMVFPPFCCVFYCKLFLWVND